MEHLEVTWYVVFTDEDVDHHWVHRFIKPGFRHCYCFRQIGDYIYYANPTTSNIDSKVFKDMTSEDLAQYTLLAPNTKVLKFKYPFDINNRMFSIWNIAPTCVSVVKMFLGITATAVTPYQLYKQLLTKGAQAL